MIPISSNIDKSQTFAVLPMLKMKQHISKRYNKNCCMGPLLRVLMTIENV